MMTAAVRRPTQPPCVRRNRRVCAGDDGNETTARKRRTGEAVDSHARKNNGQSPGEHGEPNKNRWIAVSANGPIRRSERPGGLGPRAGSRPPESVSGTAGPGARVLPRLPPPEARARRPAGQTRGRATTRTGNETRPRELSATRGRVASMRTPCCSRFPSRTRFRTLFVRGSPACRPRTRFGAGRPRISTHSSTDAERAD